VFIPAWSNIPAILFIFSTIVKILLADDHPLVREGLKLLITQFGNTPLFNGVPEFIEAQDYPSLHALLDIHRDLALAVVDLHMPGAGQATGLDKVVQAYPQVPLVVVSAFSSPDVVRKALVWPSVFAFVPKNGSPVCMHRAIFAALAREKIGEVNDAAHAPESQDLLAPRLQAVRTLLREGKSNKVIAQELGLSEGTIKNYMSEIFKSLKVTNRTQAARFDA
jgi:DNA-binding NarL/FixJ family response regulator